MGFVDKGLVLDFWTGHVNWANRKKGRSRFGWKIMSSAFDLWSWIKVP